MMCNETKVNSVLWLKQAPSIVYKQKREKQNGEEVSYMFLFMLPTNKIILGNNSYIDSMENFEI